MMAVFYVICESTANRITNQAMKANGNDSFSFWARILCDFGLRGNSTDTFNFLRSNFRRDALLIEAIHDSEEP